MLKRGFQFAPGYRLQEFLGRGQFGQVWRATAPGGAAAAVKFIDLTDGQGQKEYDGVRRVKQIRHANLMPITAIWLLDAQGRVIEEAPNEAVETIDISAVEAPGQSALFPTGGVDPSWLAVSMLLGGKSLQQRLRECVEEGLPGIPPKELISYMDESAKGLDFLNAPQHDLGEGPIAIQHCDVKPANIVLIGSSAVVCDFGLARILTRNQVTATSASGTPAYMAPEAITGKPSCTSDQYSLAVTYYHLRTGTLPVNDGSLWEVLDAHRMGKLKLGLVPEAEQDVLRKATDLNWENRFESNVEMVDSLREALRVEGHTKPSFIPASGSFKPSVNADDVTRKVSGDPTATIDLSKGPTTSVADQAAVATQPFVQAEHPTTEGFLDETMPALEEYPSVTKSIKLTVRRNPKLAVGTGIGGIVLVALMAFAISRPNVEPEPIVTPVLGGDNPVIGNGNGAAEANIVVPVDPQLLVNEAMTLFETDEAAAAKKFKTALEADPGIGSGAPLKMVGHKGPIAKMIATPDGKRLISIADDAASFVWDLGVPTAAPTKLGGHEALVTGMSMSADGDRLLTMGLDRRPMIWDLTAKDISGSALQLAGHIDEVKAAAWHPKQQLAVTASADNKVGVWRLGRANTENPHGTIEASHLFPVSQTIDTLAIDPDGTWMVGLARDVISDDVELLAYPWQAVENTLSEPASPTPVPINAAKAKIIAFATAKQASGNAILVVGDIGGGISLYEISQTPELIDTRRDAHTLDVEALKVTPLEKHDVIVSGSADGSVHWWKLGASDERQKLRLSSKTISSVDVSADGRWVAAGSYDGSVWLWDSASGDAKQAIQFVLGSGVNSVVIDPAGQWLIAGTDDSEIRLWDLQYAKLMSMAQPSPTQIQFEGPTKTIEMNQQVSMR